MEAKMADITENFKVLKIASFPKKQIHYGRYVRDLNSEISGYRLLAFKSKGFIKDYCYQRANELEKALNRAINS